MKANAMLLVAAGAVLAGAGAARAQAPEGVLPVRERIEITGSNIRRIEGEGALPLQVITREDLERAAVLSVQDIIDRVSAHQTYGAWSEAKGQGNNLSGFTAPALRGLGRERTLVLLDGRRLAPYALAGGSGVDVSSIPVSAIERVEVLKDGASAIYGTDAIGGVINFILRRDFRGVELGAQGLVTEHGGGDSWRANAALGRGHLERDGYNFFVSLDHLHQDSLRAAARESTRTSYIPWLGVDQTSINAYPANIALRPGRAVNPTIPATGATADSCAPPLSFPTATFPLLCRFDFAAVIDSIPASDKTTLLARYTTTFASGERAFVELSAYRGLFDSNISPTPVSSQFTRTRMALPPTSPYYPAGFVRANGGNSTLPIELRYRLSELGPRATETRSTLVRAIAGLDGMRWGWDYRAAAGYMQNRQVRNLVGGWVSEAAFGPLLRSGVVNPFGPNDEATLALMRATQIIGRESDNRAGNLGAELKATRSVAELAAGPLAVALGIEARRESLEQSNAEFLYTGDVIGGLGALPSLEANRRVVSLFAEANAPLSPTIEANLAVRLDRYSDFGATTNPKATLRWQPARDVLLRLSCGTGFRAPTLSDLFLPSAISAAVLPDPLRCPVTRAPEDCFAEFLVDSGGNSALQPEKSRQLNAGIVLEPARGLSVALDYYRVEIRNLIDTLGAGQALSNPGRWEASRVVRGPRDPANPDLPGPIELVLSNQINFGLLRTSGIDVDLRAQLPIGAAGRLAFAFSGTYVLDYRRGELQSSAPEGVGRRGTFDGAVSRWRHHAALDWSRGPWAATLANTFQLGYREPDPLTCRFGAACTGERRVGSYEVFDANVRYKGLRGLTLALGVRNLLDRAPPVTGQPGTFQVGIDPGYGDPRGRMFFASARYAFR